MTTQVQTLSTKGRFTIMSVLIKILSVLSLLFLFLVAIKTLESSFKMLGGGFGQGLLNVVDGPIVGLFSGMLATVLLQSSSVTTSIIVGLVTSGVLPLPHAVPMIMGANLGTSVTNTLVSLGHIKNKEHFRRAFAAATIHDFFNILTVIVLLPLELLTGVLNRSAQYLAGVFYGSASNVKFANPIKEAIKPVADGIHHFVVDMLGPESTAGGAVLVLISCVLIVISLGLIVTLMKTFVESNKGEIIEKLLTKNTLVTVLFGTGLTIAVQSSSITTSLLVPLAGAGLVSLRSVFPVTVGANIGTTATAILASLAGNPAGLAIALVHLLFNLLGALIWFVHPSMRSIPLALCEGLANATLRNRYAGPAYIAVAFFILPLAITIIL